MVIHVILSIVINVVIKFRKHCINGLYDFQSYNWKLENLIDLCIIQNYYMNFGSKKETKGSLPSEHPNLNSEIEKQNEGLESIKNWGLMDFSIT